MSRVDWNRAADTGAEETFGIALTAAVTRKRKAPTGIDEQRAAHIDRRWAQIKGRPRWVTFEILDALAMEAAE